MAPLLLLLFVYSINIANGLQPHASRLAKRDADMPYLPYVQLGDNSVQLQPRTSANTDVCSDPVNVPEGLPFGSIRGASLSVCENGVILPEPEQLRSSLCVCRGEFQTCEDPGESLYVIAPFWSDINNVSATEESSISYQVFVEGSSSHSELLQDIWRYLSSLAADIIEFFPTWVLVAHWNKVHPYIRPNEIDPRTNTFQALVATDGTQSCVIFTYNCGDLGWARTPNSFVASDCSFIGVYAGGNFNNYLPGTIVYGLQIDSRTANISRAASCSTQEASWNNFLFFLTNYATLNLTAREGIIGAKIGDSAIIQFSISAFLLENLRIEFQFIPECRCTDVLPFYFTCHGTEHRVVIEGVEIIIFCSMARLNITVANVTQGAFGDYVISVTNILDGVTYYDVAFSNLTLIDEAISKELVEMTSSPSTLTSSDITSASNSLQDLETTALTNENVRQNYLKTIDNLMQADGTAIVQSQAESNSSTRLLDSLQQFTLIVALPENTTNETFIFESYGFQIFDIDSNTFEGRDIAANLGPLDVVKNVTIPVNISFSDDIRGDDVAVYVQIEGNMPDNLDTAPSRLSVVAYRQENLFQNGTNGTAGVNIASVVMSVSSTATDPTFTLGFRPIQTYLTSEEDDTDDSVEYREVCSNFNTGGNGGQGAWSDDSCEAVQCSGRVDSNYTCCECHTYGHFGLLLAVTPVVLDENLEVVLVVFSYLGASISIICLTLLLITYISAKKLRTSTSGKLLINLAISLLGVYIFFIVGGHIRPYGDAKAVDIACGFSSALLQYFMLAYFGWTAAEALNLYFSLVKVFEAKTISSYTLKAGLIVWLVPFGIVTVSAGAGYSYYINDVYCRPVEWPFYFTFVLPIAVVLIFDCVMFVRIMLSLYQHTKQTARLKNERDTLSLKRIKQNTHYAIVLVTLFGLGWIFGLVVTGYPEAPMALTFTLQFIFCLFVSLQGFLLFLFQVIFSRDAREFWINLCSKCFPSIKAYKVSESKKAIVNGKEKKSVVKRLTGLFRAPKYSENVMQSPEGRNTSSTLDRSGQMSSGITESFEASYQISTLPHSGQNNVKLPPPTASVGAGISKEDLTSEMTTFSPSSGINFDNLSLHDDF